MTATPTPAPPVGQPTASSADRDRWAAVPNPWNRTRTAGPRDACGTRGLGCSRDIGRGFVEHDEACEQRHRAGLPGPTGDPEPPVPAHLKRRIRDAELYASGHYDDPDWNQP